MFPNLVLQGDDSRILRNEFEVAQCLSQPIGLQRGAAQFGGGNRAHVLDVPIRRFEALEVESNIRVWMLQEGCEIEKKKDRSNAGAGTRIRQAVQLLVDPGASTIFAWC